MNDDLVTWCRAQLDEEERVAREAGGDAWATGASMAYKYSHPGDIYNIAPNGVAKRIAQGIACGPDISPEQTSEHIARHNPACVLAEVEAKRRILDLYEEWNEPRLYDAICLLALPYAAQPGYREEEWRP